MLKKTISLLTIAFSSLINSSSDFTTHRNALSAENVPGTLHHAAKINDHKRALYLLHLGASKEKKDPVTGRTPSQTAHHYNAQNVIALLAQASPTFEQKEATPAPTLFFSQSSPTSASVLSFIRTCLENKQDPNIPVSPVGNLLHLATYHRLSRSVLLDILRAGARPNEINCKGETAVHITVTQGTVGNLLFLLKKGGRKDKKDHQGQTPYDLAVAHKNSVLLSLLKDEEKSPKQHHEEEYDCCICMDTHPTARQFEEITCAHKVHATCMILWRSKSATCPLCRTPLPIRKPAAHSSRVASARLVTS